jgi:lipoprotein-anchoring transpeptidase ErfK/SrfK
MRVSGRRISTLNISNERFWQIAILTVAGTIGASSQADAALYYWQDNDPGYYREVTPVQPRRQKVRRQTGRKSEVAEKETGAKPQGPLIIAVSIEKQKVRIYDANGFFAESPVSTGMPGHSTPMGVFSIIQKHKFHHSNIYSGAPMPYMQRITWSGVAMHAGVLPGYPASHGCIRMPMAFAMKMWNWTKMGARVVVTPGEMTPASFSHPLLVTQKVAPAAAQESKIEAALGTKSDKGVDAAATTKSAVTSETKLELRSTVGHAEIPASLREQTHTADASGAMPAASASATMSDATSARAPAASGEAAPIRSDQASTTELKPEATEPDEAKSEMDAVKSTEAASSDDKPVEAKPAEVTTGEAKPAGAEKTTSEAVTAAKENAKEADKSEVSASEAAKVEAKPAEPKTDDVKPETTKVDVPKADVPKAAEAVEPVKAADAPAVAPDAKKDPARLPGVAKPELPKRTGQIAVFISRKDSKLYVRQEFKPLFDAPITIAPSDRPLGTHVFTAETDKTYNNLLRWSVVTLPVTARNAARNDDDDRQSRRRRMAGAPVEAKPLPVPDSPTEALDRITIPADAMARITDALTSGASIIVSDQGINQGETGEGTDFIVSLR